MFHVIVADLATRSALIEHLKAAGILAVFHYVPLHTSPLGGSLGYEAGSLPVTEVDERSAAAAAVVRRPRAGAGR